MLGADVLRAEPDASAKVRSSAARACGSNGIMSGTVVARARQRGRGRPSDVVERDPLGGQQARGGAVGIGEQGEHEVRDPDAVVAGRAGLLLRPDDDGARLVGEPAEALAGVERAAGSARLTNRFCAACFVTPHALADLLDHDAPARRAWSTKWPISESATSPRCSASTIARLRRSRGASEALATAPIRSSRRTLAVGGVMGVNLRLTRLHDVNRRLTLARGDRPRPTVVRCPLTAHLRVEAPGG